MVLALMSLGLPVPAQQTATPAAPAIRRLVDSVRALERRARAAAPDKRTHMIADVRPAGDRSYLLFRDSSGSYARVSADTTSEAHSGEPVPLLEALNPREAAVMYLALGELLDERDLLGELYDGLATAWDIPIQDARFIIAFFDQTRFPRRYSTAQKFVLGTASPDSLRHLLGSPVPGDRRNAAFALGVLRDTAAQPELARALADGDSATVVAATSALLALGTPDANGALTAAAADLVRPLERVLRAGDSTVSPFFVAQVGRQTLQTRALAVARQIGEPAVPMLVRHWPSMTRDITGILLAIGPAAVPALEEAARGSRTALRTEATAALQAREHAVAAAAAATDNAEEFVAVVSRVLAERIDTAQLAELGPPGVELLTVAIRGLDSTQAGRVALALGRLGRRATSAVPTLIEVFPVHPMTAVRIDVTARMKGVRAGSSAAQRLTKELTDRYGPGELVRQVQGVFIRNRVEGPAQFFYQVKVPAAVAALYEITGQIPGVTRERWQAWAARRGRQARPAARP
jgi:hypothetical protein